MLPTNIAFCCCFCCWCCSPCCNTINFRFCLSRKVANEKMLCFNFFCGTLCCFHIISFFFIFFDVVFYCPFYFYEAEATAQLPMLFKHDVYVICCSAPNNLLIACHRCGCWLYKDVGVRMLSTQFLIKFSPYGIHYHLCV